MTNVLLCVGNSMMGDDGTGPLLAEKYVAASKGNWVVINGGSVPENDIVAIHEPCPMRLLIVDVTDIGLNPGETRIIDPDDIAEMFMMTAHNMPLNYLIDQLKKDIGEMILFGIQPDIVGFYYPMTQPIRDAVETVYQRLEGQEGNGGFAQLAVEAEQFLIKGFRELNIRTGMRTFLLSLVLPAQATSFTEYLSMSNSEYAQKRALKPFLTMLYDTEQNWHFRKVGVAGVTPEKMSNDDSEWQLNGKDRAGKSWSVPVEVLQNMVGNAQLHRADFDRNGIQDLVIWRSISGNGLASNAFLILMTLNQQSRPCVLQSDGFYTANETGTDDSLDL